MKTKTRWSLALVAFLLLIAGCDQVGQAVPIFDWNGPQFLVFYSIFAPLNLLVAYVWRRAQSSVPSEVSDHELPRDPYQIAYLSGGARSAVQAALAELAQRREIEVSAQGHIARAQENTTAFESNAAVSDHPLEAAILRGLGVSGASSVAQLLKDVEIAEVLQNLENQLRAASLAMPKEDALRARNATLALALLAPVVGLIKIGVGLSRDRPVGYLAGMTLLAFVIALSLFVPLVFRNSRGDKALLKLRLRHTNLKSSGAYRDLALRPESGLLALGVGLYGLQILDQTPLADLNLRRHLQASSSDGGSSSDSSSDGGSGCGGGCGGCGGGGD